MKESVLSDRSLLFAVQVVKLYRFLCINRKEFVLSKQLLRSGTAIGALIREAAHAESDADFIHKLAIARKECNETIYWLELLLQSEYLLPAEQSFLQEEATQLLRMLTASIKTVKLRTNK